MLRRQLSAATTLALLLGFVACDKVPERTREGRTPSELLELPLNEIGVRVCPAGPTVPGIDVSSWQGGSIDWDAVAASGVKFAFIRLSDGMTLDKHFARNWSEAKRVGIIRGAYQFWRARHVPEDQADFLLEQMGPLEEDDLPPVIDLETDDGRPADEVAEKVRRWIAHVELNLGRRPIIYSGLYSWPSYFDEPEFVDYDLWIPQYSPTCPTIPRVWVDWEFFQHSSTGSVPGIPGNVDLNDFNGSLDDLKALVQKSQVVCGDGRCDVSEIGACELDCSPALPGCKRIPAEGRTLDQTDRCVELGGSMTYWRYEPIGYGNSSRWTKATNSDKPSNYVVWNLDFRQAAKYKLEVFIPDVSDDLPESQKVAYQITHDGQTEVVVIDQSQAVGLWIELGSFSFSEGSDQRVRVDDNTGEPGSSNRQIFVDALRVTPLAPPTVDVDAGDDVANTPDVEADTNTTTTPDLGGPSTGDDTSNPTPNPDADATLEPETSAESDGGKRSSSGCQLGGGPSPAEGSAPWRYCSWPLRCSGAGLVRPDDELPCREYDLPSEGLGSGRGDRGGPARLARLWCVVGWDALPGPREARRRDGDRRALRGSTRAPSSRRQDRPSLRRARVSATPHRL